MPSRRTRPGRTCSRRFSRLPGRCAVLRSVMARLFAAPPVSVCLFVCLFVCLHVFCLFVCLFVCLLTCLFVCVMASQSRVQSVCAVTRRPAPLAHRRRAWCTTPSTATGAASGRCGAAGGPRRRTRAGTSGLRRSRSTTSSRRTRPSGGRVPATARRAAFSLRACRSGDNIPRLLDFVAASGRPAALLLPAWVVKKPYYRDWARG